MRNELDGGGEVGYMNIYVCVFLCAHYCSSRAMHIYIYIHLPAAIFGSWRLE